MQFDLAAAQREAKSTISRYDEARSGFSSVAADTQQLEQRAHGAGVQLLQLEEQLVAVRQQVKDTEAAKVEQQQLLHQINQVQAATAGDL